MRPPVLHLPGVPPLGGMTYSLSRLLAALAACASIALLGLLAADAGRTLSEVLGGSHGPAILDTAHLEAAFGERARFPAQAGEDLEGRSSAEGFPREGSLADGSWNLD